MQTVGVGYYIQRFGPNGLTYKNMATPWQAIAGCTIVSSSLMARCVKYLAHASEHGIVSPIYPPVVGLEVEPSHLPWSDYKRTLNPGNALEFSKNISVKSQ